MTTPLYDYEDWVLREAYGAMQVFRMLGFPSDDLYLRFGIVSNVGVYTGEACVGICLRWQNKEFNYSVAPIVEGRDEAFAQHWQALGDASNAALGSTAARHFRDLWRLSNCFANLPKLVAALEQRGIVPPEREPALQRHRELTVTVRKIKP